MKKIVLLSIILYSNLSIAQHKKPILNIYCDSASKSNILEYHSAPQYMLLDTVAHYHGYKVVYTHQKHTKTQCGQFSIDQPIKHLLSFELNIDTNYDGHNDVVFTVEDSLITVSPYCYYQIDTPATSNNCPTIDIHYDALRQGKVLAFKNADPIAVINIMAAFYNKTVIYKVEKTPGRTVTGILPLDIEIYHWTALICQAHNIWQSANENNNEDEIIFISIPEKGGAKPKL